MKKQAKQARSKQTIANILEAAIQVLIEHGYENVSTNHIARRAGHGVGTLYQYFKDKDDIFRQMIRDQVARSIETMRGCPVMPTLREQLHVLNSRQFAVYDNDPRRLWAIIQLAAGAFRKELAEGRSQARSVVADLLENHRAEITLSDLQVAADMVGSATQAVVSTSAAQLYESRVILEQLLRLQVAYLTAPDQPPPRIESP